MPSKLVLKNRSTTQLLIIVVALLTTIFWGNIFRFYPRFIDGTYDTTSEAVVIGRLTRSAVDGLTSENASLGQNIDPKRPDVVGLEQFNEQKRYFENPFLVDSAGEGHLFASADRREALYRHFVLVAKMAGRLGARACVFGAPRLRDPGDLEPAQAREIAVDFLKRIGPIYASEGTTLSVEPNSRHYACRFVTTTTEAIDLMKEVNVPGVGLQIDTGTVFLENEAPDVLIRAAPYAVHAHVSEPDLAPVGSADVDHHSVSEALRKSGYAGSLSIEMKETGDWPSALRRAVSFTRETYWR